MDAPAGKQGGVCDLTITEVMLLFPKSDIMSNNGCCLSCGRKVGDHCQEEATGRINSSRPAALFTTGYFNLPFDYISCPSCSCSCCI